MSLLVVILLVLLLFGGGWGYTRYGYDRYGYGGGIVGVLLLVLIIWLLTGGRL